MKTNAPDIMILGIGCTLYSDEGFGVQVVNKLEELYEFPDNVSVVDGGVLGINLLGVISQPDHLISLWSMPSAIKAGRVIYTGLKAMLYRSAFGLKTLCIRLISWRP
jgi:hydrogenase maturation protease